MDKIDLSSFLNTDEQELRNKKEKLFTLSDVDNYKRYVEIRDKLKTIASPSNIGEMSEYNWNKNIAKISFIIEDIITNPETNYPQIVYPMLFEKALDFFGCDSSKFFFRKKILIDLLLNMMNSQDLDEETKNTCRGMWTYYLDDDFEEYRGESENYMPMVENDVSDQLTIEQIIAHNLQEITQQYLSHYLKRKLSEQDANDLKLLIVSKDALEQHPDDDILQSARYFAQLYANDHSPIEPLSNVFVDRQRKSAQSENNKKKEPTGIPMGPHDRWYDFRNDRLLSSQTLLDDSGSIYLAEERPSKTKRDRKEITGIILPTIVLELYIDSMRKIRSTEEYRSENITADRKQEMRTEALKKFVAELLDENSKLRKTIEENSEPEVIAELLSAINKMIKTPNTDLNDLKLFCIKHFKQ